MNPLRMDAFRYPFMGGKRTNRRAQKKSKFKKTKQSGGGYAKAHLTGAVPFQGDNYHTRGVLDAQGSCMNCGAFTGQSVPGQQPHPPVVATNYSPPHYVSHPSPLHQSHTSHQYGGGVSHRSQVPNNYIPLSDGTAQPPLATNNQVHQNVLWNAQGGEGCMEPINQGGQRFVFPSQANTVCQNSVYPADGQVRHSQKGGRRRIQRRRRRLTRK